MQPNSLIWVWAYRRGSGIIIPSPPTVYGTKLFISRIDRNFSSRFHFEISRSEINALDKQSQRCDPSEEEPSVSLCIERYMEKHWNCSLKRLLSNPNLGICNQTKWNSTDIGASEVTGLMGVIGRMDEREIFEVTGCMPGCSKSKIELLSLYHDNMIDDGQNVAMIFLNINTGEYDLWEEYYIYNWGSFIADVGGYLGLLLGCSVLSLYHMLTPWLMTQMKRLVKWMGKYLDKFKN